MSTVFAKLNLRTQRPIVVLDAPAEFEAELANLQGVEVERRVSKPAAFEFALIFVKSRADIERCAKALARLPDGDFVLWFAYPKSTSKRYSCDINRDTGWEAVRALGLDTVRAVAIDADWSALRFRRVEFIARASR